ncbi:DUF3530 family protein [Lacimicrobium sp. SS2-24]|uniref:DUF3530 family protein n=1 Tax=Lacimicrobium sp. SS2-24 TaxID=2005569 RepID=UPI00143A6E06|nr:DUF3530 family protein [Lacimicrobium sp. SS2-24]
MSSDSLVDQDVQRALPEHAYRQLQSAEDSFVALFSEHSIANNMGVAILLNDTGMAHTSPQSLGPLARYLNAEGWVTLVMTAPPLPRSAESQSPVTNNEDTETADIRPFEAIAQTSVEQFETFTTQLTQRVDAAKEFASGYPGFVLVVAQGISAAALLNRYSEQQQNLPDALVTVSPYWPDRQRNHQLAQQMAEVPIPVLDIYNRWNNAWTLSERQQRLIAAQKALKLHYRQREIIGTQLIAGQYPYIAKEVQGWLIYMGW